MSKDEHVIVQLVYDAKGDMEKADHFIMSYLPFIKSETAKFLKRPPIEGRDDELSIAMIAFHEAIERYSRTRGAFLSYASLVMKNRLIDYWRTNKKHRDTLSLDTPVDEENPTTLGDSLTDDEDPTNTRVVRNATREEIEELSMQLHNFGVSLTDVAENSPKQGRTMEACKNALNYTKQSPKLMEKFLRTKRLPIKDMAIGADVAKKTLERHRKYLIALLLIYSNGYEIIRGHLSQVMKGEN